MPPQTPQAAQSDPWAVVSHAPTESPQQAQGGGDPWTVVSHAPIQQDQPGLLHRAFNWTFGIGPQYEHQGLIEQLQHKMESTAAEREHMGERGEMTPLQTALDVTAPNVMASGLRLYRGIATPGNVALGGLAAIAPPTAPAIGTYFALSGAHEAMTPQQPGESSPEALERRLTGAAGAAGGMAMVRGGAPATMKFTRQLMRRTPSAPKQVEALGSLIDSRGGATDPHAMAGDVLPVLRNQLALDKVDIHQLKGRAAGQTVLNSARNAVRAHQAEVSEISKPYANVMTDQAPIAAAYRGYITPELQQNAPEVARRLEAEAKKFDQPAPLSQINATRIRLNNETEAAQGKAEGGLRKSDLETRADVAAVQAAREVQYSNLARISGLPEEYIRGLQRVEGQLMETRDSLAKQFNLASEAQAEHASSTFRERVGGHVFPSKHGAISAVVRGTGVLSPQPIEAFNSRLRMAFGNLEAGQPAPTYEAVPGARTVERRATPRPSQTQMSDYYNSRFAEVRKGLREATTPEEKASYQQQLDNLKQAVQQEPQAQAGAGQGGHAGGGVSSVEELSRPGTNYVVSQSGKLSYHGKSFAPESTPAGATHVTVLPNGQFRVNAGQTLTPVQEAALRQALPQTPPARPAPLTQRVQAQPLPRLRQIQTPQPPTPPAPRGGAVANRQAAISAVMASLKRGDISQAQADRQLQRLRGGGSGRTIRMPASP